MFTSPRAAMRLRFSIASPVFGTGLGGAVACAMTSHPAVSAYQPSADARNAAKGGACAWSPPV